MVDQPSQRRISLPTVALLGVIGIAISILAFAQHAPPREVVKIGLVAPFDGRYREIGTDIIPAVRLALREWPEYTKNQPHIIIELVSYDDVGDPDQAAIQAEKILADPDVAIVIGHWRESTSEAAALHYDAAGLPFITYTQRSIDYDGELINLAVPDDLLEQTAQDYLDELDVEGLVLTQNQGTVQRDARAVINARTASPSSPIVGAPDWGLRQWYDLGFPASSGVTYISDIAPPHITIDPALQQIDMERFIEAYKVGSLGTEPGPYALTAYIATWTAIQHIADMYDITIVEPPVMVPEIQPDSYRLEAGVYLYRWENATRTLIESRLLDLSSE